MNILIRADSSLQIGTGHIMRCITLADFLKKNGCKIKFICRDLKGNIISLIESKGYPVFKLFNRNEENTCVPKDNSHSHWLEVSWQEDADETVEIIKEHSDPIDLMIVDHYAIDSQWERVINKFVKKIMVIDDLADRYHQCDILLDQNLIQNMNKRYEKLVSDKSVCLIGPKYALLRPEFEKARQMKFGQIEEIRRLFVFFGGVDRTNETTKTLNAIKLLKMANLHVDVVVGSSNPHKEIVRALCNSMKNTQFYCQINNMAELMAMADLAVSAGGSTTWERFSVGLPSLTIAVARNQIPIAEASQSFGIDNYLGISKEVFVEKISKSLFNTFKDITQLNNSKQTCMKLVDGRGVNRVGTLILNNGESIWI